MRKAITVSTRNEIDGFNLVRGKTLEQLQKVVGGLIQPIDITDSITMWVNEEGKFNGSKYNQIATQIWEGLYGKTDVIYGDVVFTGGSNKRGNLLGLSAKNADEVTRLIVYAN